MNSALSLFEGKEGYALSPCFEEEKLSSEKKLKKRH
jgi:hypothetical protein